MLLNSKAPDAKMAEGAFSININKIKIFVRILVIKGGFFKIKGKNKNLGTLRGQSPFSRLLEPS